MLLTWVSNVQVSSPIVTDHLIYWLHHTVSEKRHVTASQAPLLPTPLSGTILADDLLEVQIAKRLIAGSEEDRMSLRRLLLGLLLALLALLLLPHDVFAAICVWRSRTPTSRPSSPAQPATVPTCGLSAAAVPPSSAPSAPDSIRTRATSSFTASWPGATAAWAPCWTHPGQGPLRRHRGW